MWMQTRRFGIGGLCLLIGLLCLLPLYALAEVDINEKNFPDANFRAFLETEAEGADGILTDEEIEGFTHISVVGHSIESLEGIVVFRFLEDLMCNENALTTLPILPSGLKEIRCMNNQLTALSTLPSGLEYLDCRNNHLTAVDLSSLSKLTYFDGSNQTAALLLTANDTGNYSLAIELNDPSGLADGLSYANGVLTSDNKRLDQSVFMVQTGKAGYTLGGTFTLTYGEMIAASAGEGGSITPSGNVGVVDGEDQTFAIKADTGYRIKDVLVNGASIGKEASYTFTDVQTAGSIAAQFEKIPYTVTASRTLGGSITPLGKTTVLYGGSQAYTIVPDAGYRIQDVKVNGKSIGVVTSYTFENVKADAMIEVSFEKADYTITASAGKGGTISPTGAVGVLHGESQTFTLTAEDGYRVKDVKVNGRSLGVMNSYTFSNVQADATIEVSFEKVDYTITASAGKGGTISPTGAVGVLHGESQTFTLTAEDGYRVKDVKVNGKSLGVMNSYTFSNVQADATIEAIFEERPIDPVPPTGDRFPLEMLFVSLVGMVLLAVVLLLKAKKA